MTNLTNTLCTGCGLCCDGSLFADVELAGADEALTLEVMGLAIEDDEGDRELLLQPCGALSGKCCSIYAYRPNCCRSFECRLLQQVKRGVLSVDQAREKIAEATRRIEQVRRFVDQLSGNHDPLPLKERCAEGLAGSAEGRGTSRQVRKRRELEIGMARVEQFIQRTFLG